ncbi:MAG: FTR1 family protein [Caldilineaceae bacterium]|nr:FTR1 family protein [Caldilineaceae bacterium]
MKLSKLLAVVALVAVLCLTLIGPVTAAPTGPADVNVPAELAQMRDLLQESMRAYRQGDYDQAYKLARAAYLDHFELVEIPLRVVNADLTLEMEYRMADLRTKMQAGASAAEVEASVRLAREGLLQVETMYTEVGALVPALAFTGSFTIIFREGLEAVLVIAALLGYLQKAGGGRKSRNYIFLGIGGAVVFSVITWLLLRFVLSIAPVGRELLEAIVSLVAVGMLFWVSFWLVSRLDRKRWMEFLNARSWAAMTSGSSLALAGLGFTAVYREGFETALFYEVLLGLSARAEVYVFYGFIAGLAVLSVVAWLILRAGQRMPVQKFMTAAVSVVMLLSVAFIGNAIQELQNTGLLGVTSLMGLVPRLPTAIANFTGIHPTVETLAAQVILLVIYIAGGVWMWWSGRPKSIAANAENNPNVIRGAA